MSSIRKGLTQTLTGFLAALVLFSTPAQALRCDGRLVDTGDLRTEVREKCGAPDYRSEFTATFLPGIGPIQATEHWYYNPGPQRFIQRLVFRGGRLRHVESLGRGFAGNGGGQCSPGVIERGLSEFELHHRCGVPLEERTEWHFGPSRSHSGHPRQAVPVQEWLYEFGDNRFRRLVILRAGEVVATQRRDKPR